MASSRSRRSSPLTLAGTRIGIECSGVINDGDAAVGLIVSVLTSTVGLRYHLVKVGSSMLRRWGGAWWHHGECEMQMPVVFVNGEIGTVTKDILDDSIRGQKVIAFLRSSGWVHIGRDSIRKAHQPFMGSGKRWGDLPS